MMAKLDGTYWLEFDLPSDRNQLKNQSLQCLLTPGSGTATLKFFGQLHGFAPNYTNPDGTKSTQPATPNIDMTLSLTGYSSISPAGTDRFLLVDNSGRLAGIVRFWAQIVLATGGANDGDFEFEGPPRSHKQVTGLSPWERGWYWPRS